MINNASGLIHVTDNLFLLADDNRDQIRLFRFSDDASKPEFRELNVCLNLGDGGHGNSDFESLAMLQDDVYVIGNRQPRLRHFRLNGHALAGPPAAMTPDLRTDLFGDDINIEALSAWRGNQLLVGLRKPAAEDGHAQALLLDPAGPEAAPTPILFDLGGRRFRDCVRIDDQHFLILAGPKKDADSDRKNKTKRPIFFWNGDLTSSEPIQPRRCRLNYGKFRAEGLCIRRKDQQGLEIFIGSDESAVDPRDPFKLRYATVSSIEQLLTDTIPTRKVRVELYGYD